MRSMGYCRFQNALKDCQDVYTHLEDNLERDSDEWKARSRLIEWCVLVAEEFGESEQVEGYGPGDLE